MLRRKYRIQMRTPLGNRAGTLEVQIKGNRVAGHMEVLERVEPFEGSIDEHGFCGISGTLVTFMSTIPYTATGQITPDSIRLTMKGGENLFSVTGTICQEE